MIKLNDLSRKIALHRPEINKAFSDLLDKGSFVLGSEVTDFEQAFAEYSHVKFCITTGNGTDALELGLRALNVQKNDQVATVANAGFYTSTALLAIGAIPYYLDVSLDTHLVTFDSIKQAIVQGIKTVVITHLYGQCVPEILEIKAYCQDNQVSLLEDCAQAHGAKLQGQTVGSFGEVACFSFYPSKNLGALGDGGAVLCSNPDIAQKLKLLRQYGWKDKYCIDLLGGKNSRLDEMQAAMLNVFLPHLDTWNKQRRMIAEQYTQGIHHHKVICPLALNDGSYVAHLYVVRCKEREALSQYLEQKHGIITGIHYPIPDHHQPIWKDQLLSKQLPNTEQLAKEILTLPCYPEMTYDEVQKVINAINHWQC